MNATAPCVPEPKRRLAAIAWLASAALASLGSGCGGSADPASEVGRDGNVEAPVSCESAEQTCGSVNDGSGHFLACGRCDAPSTCGGSGAPGRCGCTPRTCESLGANCGPLEDGCGGTLDCGDCSAPDTCGGGALPNVCGRPVCDDSVCFVAPYPQPDDLFALHEDPTGVVWAGGGVGRVLRAGPETAWEHVDAFTRSPASIEDFWVSESGEEGWAVGSGARGALLRFDGTRFNCARPDGSFWAELSEADDITWDLHAIWGESESDLWAVGDEGALHFDGERWAVDASFRSNAELWEVAGFEGTGLWAVGRRGASPKPVIMQRVDEAWTDVTPAAADVRGELRAISVDQAGRAWAGGVELDAEGRPTASLVLMREPDGAWTRLENGSRAALYTAATDEHGGIWFAGAGGALLHGKGGNVRSLPKLLGPGDIHALSREHGVLRAAGSGGLLAEWRRGLWWPNRTRSLAAAQNDPVSWWELDPDWAWAGGNGWVMHFDGRRWGTAALAANIVGFFGVSPRALWIAGNDDQGGVVYFYDGHAFTEVARTDMTLVSMTGTSSTDVRAIAGSRVLHYDGSSWSAHASDAFADAPPSPPGAQARGLDAQGGFLRDANDRAGQQLWPYAGLEQGAATALADDSGQIWAAGPDGVLRVDESPRLLDVCGSVRALAASEGAVWLAGDADDASDCGPLRTVVDDQLRRVRAPRGETHLTGVSVNAHGETWVSGAGLHRRLGSDMEWERMRAAGEEPFQFVHVTDTGEAWTAAGPELFHYHAGEWEVLEAWALLDYPAVGVIAEELWLHDVFALPTGEAFFIGTTRDREAALLLMYIDGEWSSALPLQALDGPSVFTDVWAASRSEIYVSKGEIGYVYTFDATNGSPSFDTVTAAMDGPFGALCGSPQGALWMFGAGGTVARTVRSM